MSISSMLGIVIGVSVLIIGLSSMNGFEYELKNHLLSVVPHGQIVAINQPYLNWRTDLDKIRQTFGIVTVSPYINFVGLLEKGNNLKVVQVTGINLLTEKAVSLLSNLSFKNAWKKLKLGNNKIILGQGIASILKVSPGDSISIIIPNYGTKLCIKQLNKISVIIADVFKLNNILDYQLVILPLKDAQQYLSYEDSITGFQVSVNNVFAANEIVHNAGMNTSQYVAVKSWIDDYGYIYNDIQMVRSILYLAMILVIFVASFNIISTLMITVKDKSNAIAILKTLGAKNNFIYTIFLLYGLIIGIVGYFIGMLVGVFISVNLTSIIRYVEKVIGYSVLSSDIYFINFLPSKVNFVDILYIMLITLILSLLASWYPAKQAIKIDPVRILSWQ